MNAICMVRKMFGLLSPVMIVPFLLLSSCTASDKEPSYWVDETTGLYWQNPPRDSIGNGINPLDATKYCSDLGEGWRLPNSNELRSLIRGCPNVELGGACGVIDPGCLDIRSPECYDNCNQDGNELCRSGDGPGEDGYYQPPELLNARGGNEYYSSSVELSSIDEHPSYYWNVNFRAGIVSADAAPEYSTRCVRDEPL